MEMHSAAGQSFVDPWPDEPQLMLASPDFQVETGDRCLSHDLPERLERPGAGLLRTTILPVSVRLQSCESRIDAASNHNHSM